MNNIFSTGWEIIIFCRSNEKQLFVARARQDLIGFYLPKHIKYYVLGLVYLMLVLVKNKYLKKN
ncbi:MAG: hypothetical protein COT34_01960 [Candidatus Nealsonbacteria bacterium CG08_land_8_20_14_0_20_43_11]|uniref:Uncharacterized protein n=1 Tax=Candidatus Nealsonbacteria bacterium CG08_land_8_20_14_0_20_43_11 TaxID=1974706 RepID=A0A2M6T0P6_9BACT|nr:MAG: hypothetical protein COT34_01960 [Candidatus Nealsonbacteria bacterium CG08_land_8_20_14_0_20_43_11]